MVHNYHICAKGNSLGLYFKNLSRDDQNKSTFCEIFSCGFICSWLFSLWAVPGRVEESLWSQSSWILRPGAGSDGKMVTVGKKSAG